MAGDDSNPEVFHWKTVFLDASIVARICDSVYSADEVVLVQ